jgi:DNA modification methylase
MPQVSLELLHRFHSYCARFPSEIVEAVLESYTKPGDSVFDPFCGSGTTLVAGLAHQRKVIGADIDTLAGMLSEVKCTPYPPERYAQWRTQFVAKLAQAFEEIARAWRPCSPPRPGTRWALGSLELRIPEFPELNYWFPPQLTAALATIAATAQQCQEPHYERVALIALSASIISKWPNTLSYAMDIDHTRPHRRLRQFTLDQVLTTYVSRLDRSLACLGTLYQVYRDAGVHDTLIDVSCVIYPHDAREPLQAVREESQELVITSPPYFNAVDYPRAHRMSVCWMNGYAPADLASRRNYIGLRHAPEFSLDDWLRTHPTAHRLLPAQILSHHTLGKRLCAFFADLEIVLHQIWRALKPGGHAALVIANNVIKGHRIASHKVLMGLATDIGFMTVRTTPRAIATLHRRFPVGPFGFDGPMTHEYLVVLQKPYRRPRRRARSEGKP